MKTRVGLFRAVGEPLEVVELDLAEPGRNDVVVRIAAAGICGTDLHQVKGEWQRPTPMVLGHEGAGIVEHVGDAVDSVAVGDEVVLSWAPSCGHCADCARGGHGGGERRRCLFHLQVCLLHPHNLSQSQRNISITAPQHLFMFYHNHHIYIM